MEDKEEHFAQGASIRARLPWDVNGEGPGKTLENKNTLVVS